MSNRPKIAAMLRVKNEARWIPEVLEALRPICFATMVLDDHSTDETAILAERARAIVLRSRFEGIDEARDKDFLLRKLVEAFDPEWVLCVDGDEVLEPRGPMKLLAAIASNQAHAYRMQVIYLWDRTDQVRVDGIYGDFRRASLFNARRSTCRFAQTDFGGNFHCSNVPADMLPLAVNCDARLKHYGYIDREMRIAKWHWYNSVDPDNRREDRYRHMVQGDVPEVPADEQLLHAGPLRLAAWN